MAKSDVTYNYTIDQFLNQKYDLSKLTKEVTGSSIVTALNYMNGDEGALDIIFKADLDGEDWSTLSGVVAAHDGISDGVDYQEVMIVGSSEDAHVHTDLFNEFRDRSGKLRVHQTSRKIGTIIQWTGEGDDPTNPSVLGGGERLTFDYTVGTTEPLVKYIDFNIVENETWLHEGYLTWKGAHLDRVDLKMVCRATGIEVVGTGGNYNLYGGYMIVPAVPGEGSVNITSDITTHSGGLVYMPNNDSDETPTAFWDADWNTATKEYENIAPNLTGQGRYNMFPAEITFAHFVRGMPLLGTGFIALNSSDTDQMGHGMRLKFSLDVNTETTDDHDVALACTMCLHRAKVA